MISSNLSSGRWIATSFLLFLAIHVSHQLPSTPSTSPKSTIAHTASEVEDLKNSKYTGGVDVDELYSTSTASSHSRSRHGSPPVKVNNSSSSVADLMVGDFDPDNIIEEIAGTSKHKHEGSRRISTNFAAAIVAGICLFVALASYGALMIWRNMTNARYANRAMLLTDDDMGDIQDEDLRHFELKELNRELRTVSA